MFKPGDVIRRRGVQLDGVTPIFTVVAVHPNASLSQVFCAPIPVSKTEAVLATHLYHRYMFFFDEISLVEETK